MMSIEDFNGFCNGLLSAYLNREEKEGGEVLGLCIDYGVTPGSGRFNRALTRVMSWIERGDFSRLNRDNATSLKASGIQVLIAKYGAEFGKDVSLTADGGLFISNELLARTMSDLSPFDREILEREGVGKTLHQNPYLLLEEQLGTPFFTNLVRVGKLRISTLSDADAAIYLPCLLSGVIARHPWLIDDDFFVTTAIAIAGDRVKEIARWGEQQEDLDNVDLIMNVHAIDDLLTAAGRIDRKYHPETGEMLLSKDDLMTLDRVWMGEKMRPAVLADLLTASR